jgi:galactokinase
MIPSSLHTFMAASGTSSVLVASPGRVNLIGEHTDYNAGFVLPGAIDQRIYIGLVKNETSEIRVYSSQFGETSSFDLSESLPRKGWINYLIGLVYYLQQAGGVIAGMEVYIDGDLPAGAGLSSSAALCCGFGVAVNELFDLQFSREELAKISQRTEHEFAGVKCGLMDQYAILFGKAGYVLQLDCRDFSKEYVPFDFPDYQLVLVNTRVSHSLANTEYNVRRQQCEEGVQVLKKYYPDISSLRDVTYEQLIRHWKTLDPVVFDRCSYVVNENQRLLAGCEALRRGDLAGFGEMMYASHKGLSKRYAVSCAELDFLVEQAKNIPGVMGARMMGGGFGGCTLNIVHREQLKFFQDQLAQRYTLQFGQSPEFYSTTLQDGVQVVNFTPQQIRS